MCSGQAWRVEDDQQPDSIGHFALISNSLMIGHHCSALALTKAPSASPVCRSRGKTSNPRSSIRERTAGSAKASMVVALRLQMTLAGVPLGANSPSQAVWESADSPISAKVGMLGASAMRAVLVTP